MRILINAFAVFLIVAFCFIGFYRWDSAVNRGWNRGYWGEFNRTSNALSSISGVKIVKQWHNLDVTLEEFGFEIETNGRTIRLSIGESDAVRRMPYQKAFTRLQTLIEQEMNQR
jgi:hypothetical protein